MKTLNELKCIEMTCTNTDGNTSKMMLSFNEFKNSFIDERWKNERRTKSIYTMFGKVQTRTTVTSPLGEKSIRDFDFPRTREEAERRDSESEGK